MEFCYGDRVQLGSRRGSVVDERLYHREFIESVKESPEFIEACTHGVPVFVRFDNSCIPQWADGRLLELVEVTKNDFYLTF